MTIPQNSDSLPIVALDPGLTQTGVVLIAPDLNQFKVQAYYLPTSPQDVNWWEKSKTLGHLIDCWIGEYTNGFDYHLAIEEPFVPRFNRAGYYGIQNRFIGMLFQRTEAGRIFLVHPKTAKLHLTGKGNAEKHRMVRAAHKYTTFPTGKAKQEALADAVGVGKATWEHLRAGTKGVIEFNGN